MNAPFLIIVSFILAHIHIIRCEKIDIVKESSANNTSTQAMERSSHHHYEAPNSQGFWKERLFWRSRWVKTWQEKKIYVAVWKRMWGPAVVKEWVPVPKPPPGWTKNNPGAHFIKVGVH